MTFGRSGESAILLISMTLPLVCDRGGHLSPRRRPGRRQAATSGKRRLI
ncbi:MAG TPA: hypothetical protein VL485_12150 [Ktedonobacteraceae bacterium]|nr:hypothetical protein [Ktedonobacteraceae bacterium]